MSSAASIASKGLTPGEPLVLSLDEVSRENVTIAGGKGASLGEMIQAGVPVPAGIVVTSAGYRSFLHLNALDVLIARHLDALDINDPAALQEASAYIQGAMGSASMPPDLLATIQEAYVRLGGSRVAVRSSATAEDLPTASFAGQQRTYLNVEGQANVVQAVQACWASLFEPRAIFYRTTQGFNHQHVNIAVVVQRMVPAEVSGVMFTVDPSTDTHDAVLIEAIYGLGEPLVSGELSPDAYTVAKATGQVISRTIAAQSWLLRQRSTGSDFQRGTVKSPVPRARQKLQKLGDRHIMELAQLGLQLERHYDHPQDIEWALAEDKLFILQSRPITTLQHPSQGVDTVDQTLTPILTGAPASPGIGVGRVLVLQNAKDIYQVQDGDVLVAEMTTPDFVPAMKRASAIVTDRGGRTCHAAIVSREMGIPCVVGTGNGSRLLYGLPTITVDGGAGKIYKGDQRTGLRPSQSLASPTPKVATRTKLYVNLASPDAAGRVASMDVDGVGLLRAEFILAHIGEHPRAMVEAPGGSEEFIQRLSEGLEIFARSFQPRPVVYRFSDFKTNEYRNLKGGEAYESFEENPMLGYRGCSRYLAEPDLFHLEVEAVKQIRKRYPNLWVMLPFVRTVQELQGVKAMLEEAGLTRGPDFQVWMMVEVPSNVFLLDDFLNVGVDGVSIGSNDLTQLILGVDRDNEKLVSVFDERNPAVLRALEMIVKGSTARGVSVSICGQAPSVYPELTRQLVSWGITSISVAPDMIQETRRIIQAAEAGGS